MAALSVVVITKNEERNIARCLKSVASVANEIIIVDSGSIDRTKDIAASLGARIIDHPWEGSFTAQKNFAILQARSDWVLSLDADEWISEALSDEILHAINVELESKNAVFGYLINRRTQFLGKYMRCWQPDWIFRLFRRGHARFIGGLVHEELVIQNKAKNTSLKRLHAHLNHEAYRSLDHYIEKMNFYTTMAADSLQRNGRSFHICHLLIRPVSHIFKTLFIKGGWRDGVRGIILSFASGFYVFLKYSKLYALKTSSPESLSDDINDE